MSQLHYLPLSPLFFAALVALFVVLVALIQVGLLRYAYMRLGVSSKAAFLLLLGSLIGSYFNIPIWHLPEETVSAGREIVFFGVHYMVPVVEQWPGTIIAVNVGGAVIPGIMSIYLLARNRLWVKGAVAVAAVAAVCHWLAHPVPGVGIAIPILLPAAITAIVSMLLSSADAAPLAYISGSLGTLIGADLLNLDKVSGLGAPIASIGGAGTFDGIFITAILAVLLASISRPRRWRASAGHAQG
jgi:uncharacterized membrane protein